MKPQGQECLQENGSQRNEDGRPNTEAVNLDLLTGCVGNSHAIVDCPEPEVGVEVRPPEVGVWVRPRASPISQLPSPQYREWPASRAFRQMARPWPSFGRREQRRNHRQQAQEPWAWAELACFPVPLQTAGQLRLRRVRRALAARSASARPVH